MANDEERKFRLWPRKPAARSERRIYASAYKIILHYARMSHLARRRVVRFGTNPGRTRPYSQRWAVRVVYSKNASKGQWRTHGRFLVHETDAV